MKVFQREHSLRTTAGLEIRDITDEVKECVAESAVNDGIAVGGETSKDRFVAYLSNLNIDLIEPFEAKVEALAVK